MFFLLWHYKLSRPPPFIFFYIPLQLWLFFSNYKFPNKFFSLSVAYSCHLFSGVNDRCLLHALPQFSCLLVSVPFNESQQVFHTLSNLLILSSLWFPKWSLSTSLVPIVSVSQSLFLFFDHVTCSFKSLYIDSLDTVQISKFHCHALELKYFSQYLSFKCMI